MFNEYISVFSTGNFCNVAYIFLTLNFILTIFHCITATLPEKQILCFPLFRLVCEHTEFVIFLQRFLLLLIFVCAIWFFVFSFICFLVFSSAGAICILRVFDLQAQMRPKLMIAYFYTFSSDWDWLWIIELHDLLL